MTLADRLNKIITLCPMLAKGIAMELGYDAE